MSARQQATRRFTVEHVDSAQGIHTLCVTDLLDTAPFSTRQTEVWYANGTVRCVSCSSHTTAMRTDCPHANVARYWLRKGRFPQLPPLPPIQRRGDDSGTMTSMPVSWHEPGVAESMWPLIDVLEHLADAAEHLLQVHDCDHHGYEVIDVAMRQARARVAALRRGHRHA